MKSKEYLRPKSLEVLDGIGLRISEKQVEEFTGKLIIEVDFSNGTACRATGRKGDPEWRFP